MNNNIIVYDGDNLLSPINQTQRQLFNHVDKLEQLISDYPQKLVVKYDNPRDQLTFIPAENTLSSESDPNTPSNNFIDLFLSPEMLFNGILGGRDEK
jgi:hypothetical protein